MIMIMIMIVILSWAVQDSWINLQRKRLKLPRHKLAPSKHGKDNKFISKNTFIILTCLMQLLPIMSTGKLKLILLE